MKQLFLKDRDFEPDRFWTRSLRAGWWFVPFRQFRSRHVLSWDPSWNWPEDISQDDAIISSSILSYDFSLIWNSLRDKNRPYPSLKLYSMKYELKTALQQEINAEWVNLCIENWRVIISIYLDGVAATEAPECLCLGGVLAVGLWDTDDPPPLRFKPCLKRASSKTAKRHCAATSWLESSCRIAPQVCGSWVAGCLRRILVSPAEFAGAAERAPWDRPKLWKT